MSIVEDARWTYQCGMHHRIVPWPSSLLALTLAAFTGCARSGRPASHASDAATDTASDTASDTATGTAPAEHRAPVETTARLVAVLTMRGGFGPGDHDAYEARISPIGRVHGMTREAAYTVTRYLGGSGPAAASTVGIWTLAEPTSLPGVMSDPRYQAEVPGRDRLHDLAASAMYVGEEVFTGPAPAPGHVLLVGLLAMRPGFGYADHDAYERSLAAVTERHGMRLSRAVRITRALSGSDAVVAVNVWELPDPAALTAVMSDPEYVAHVAERDRIHDMGATTMYFVAARADRRCGRRRRGR
jgi:hypothetical protein